MWKNSGKVQNVVIGGRMLGIRQVYKFFFNDPATNKLSKRKTGWAMVEYARPLPEAPHGPDDAEGCALLALGRKQEAVLVLEQGYNTALLQTADVKQLLELHELLNLARREIDVTVNHHAAETTRQETPVSPLGSYTAFGTSDNKVSTSMAVFESGACSSANTHESSMEFGEHSKTNKESGGSTELRKAIQSNPAAGEAWKRRGQARAALGEFAEAVEALTRALELEPKSPDILHERGKCLCNGLSFAYLGEYIKAEEAHLKSIQLDSNYLEAWLHLAQFYQELADYSKALECIDQVLQVDNRVWKAYHFRGFVFHGLGEHRSPFEQKNVLIETENFDGEYRDAKGYLEVVRTLLSVGVSLKAITRKGLTPLPYAAQGSQLDLVKYLVKKGANVRATTKLVAVSQVRNILGLGTREAEAITVDVTSKAYRKRLAIHEVRKATHGLRLSRETAMSIASKATSKGAQEDDCLESLRKTRPDKELAEKMGKPGQTEITLKNDLPERDRIDLYKTYLLYCLTGEVTRIPFGAQITTKRDDSEYLLLNQLGGILGLISKEIVNIHVGLGVS
ncbi:hypothetical protein Bca52824_089160 [Brassica carinata]|uniref:NAC domain-containing protein n=1 Tax=Brassica carinata TaxID=52824 RepID=A0A8X7PEL5_BRACI|nr:hypothetical protein Bca52824_089160 [Brassica carinata]